MLSHVHRPIRKSKIAAAFAFAFAFAFALPAFAGDVGGAASPIAMGAADNMAVLPWWRSAARFATRITFAAVCCDYWLDFGLNGLVTGSSGAL